MGRKGLHFSIGLRESEKREKEVGPDLSLLSMGFRRSEFVGSRTKVLTSMRATRGYRKHGIS